MDIITGAASSAAVQVGNGVFPIIARHIKYLFCYGETPKKLKKQVQEMVPTRDGIRQRVDAAKEVGDIPLPDVMQWLDDFQKVESEAKNISEGVQRVCCFNYCCWNLFLGYSLSKKATNQIDEVKRLWANRNFPIISSRPQAPGVDYRFSTNGFQIFAPTKQAMEQVLEALNKKDNYIIGVCGMGGVGKTTLVQEVVNRAKNEKFFEKVVMATVSQNPNLEKLQEEIAEGLGFTLQSRSQSGRVAELLKRLKELKSILIVLDDVWGRLDFNAVGIPSKVEHEGCKVVMTTRKLYVCTVIESNCNINVDTLSKEESWELFKLKAGIIIESPSLVKLARDVVEECKGLPLALVILGSSMGNKKDVYEWEVVLKELQSSTPTNIGDMEKQVFLSIKRSIDDLGDEIRSCFLICCLFPEDFQINLTTLTYYVMGERLLKNSDTLIEAEKRVHYFINKLKESCLLLDCHRAGYVKMHDVVRDVAKWAAEATDGFLIKAGIGLTSWNAEADLKKCTRISLNYNRIEVLPEQPMCPKVRMLTLYGNSYLNVIPNNFFHDMKSLLVLDLSLTGISQLPNSMSYLIHLKTLMLDGYCGSDGSDIFLVGELKQLEILSLSGCKSFFSAEVLGNLTHLMYLNLEECKNVNIPRNVLARLSRLERLYMRYGFDKWQVEQDGATNLAAFSELACLPCLTHLFITIDNKECMSSELIPYPFRRLIAFEVTCTGCENKEFTPDVKRLAIKKPTLNLSNWNKELLKDVNDLELFDWEGTECLITDVEGENIPRNALCDLEAFEIRKMPHLKKIVKGPLSSGSLQKLKTLYVSRCDELRHILSTDDMLTWTHGLRKLKVERCKKLQAVFCYDDEHKREGGGVPTVLLPQLEELNLFILRELTSIWEGIVPHGTTLLQNLRKLQVHLCHSLKYILSTDDMLSTWTHGLGMLRVEECRKLQAVFCYDDEHKREGGVVPTVLLSQLESLYLRILPELTSIWEGIVPHGTLLFQNLIKLHVDECHSLKYIVSPDLAAARAFQQLQDLSIYQCRQLQKIIGSDDDDDDEMEVRVGPPSSSSLFRHPIFPNLQTLEVSLCDRLSSLFSWRQAVHDVLHLEKLAIWNCNAMEEIIRSEEEGEDMMQQQPLFPRLQILYLENLPLLRSFHQGRSMRCISLHSLDCLNVKKCPVLKELPIGPGSSPNLQKREGDVELIETLELHDGSIESSESRDPQTSSSYQSRADIGSSMA